jgi:hypothetical protein
MSYSPRPKSSSRTNYTHLPQINPRHIISIIYLFDSFYESLLPIPSIHKTTSHGSEEQIIVTNTDNIMHCIFKMLKCGKGKEQGEMEMTADYDSIQPLTRSILLPSTNSEAGRLFVITTALLPWSGISDKQMTEYA